MKLVTDNGQLEETEGEPTNEQLANFLIVIAPRIVGAENLHLDRDMLMRLLEKPAYRAAALSKHRKFVEEQHALIEKMERGMLRCAHIRDNGKKCPNFQEPGSWFCGLHRHLYEIDEEEVTEEG